MASAVDGLDMRRGCAVGVVKVADRIGIRMVIISTSGILSPMDPVALTRQLVDIESTTGNEAAVVEFLGNYLSAAGLTVERMPV